MGVNSPEEFSSYPIPIQCLDNISAIGCGNKYSAALKNNGLLYFWGLSMKSENKEQDEINRSPTQIIFPSNIKISKFACGSNHMLCLSLNDNIFSFGSSAFGKLGLGPSNDQRSPIQLDLFGMFNTIIDISCGQNHSACIVINSLFGSSKVSGILFTWGRGSEGQLGNGSFSEKSVHSPFKVEFPIQFKQVSCGDFHTIAIGEDNKMYACGSSQSNQLGIKDSLQINKFKLIQMNSNEPISKVFSFSTHNFALTRTDCYMWGYCKTQMSLGLRQLPEVPPNSIQISCGIAHTCSLDNNGQVYSWGRNTEVLGYETNENYSLPKLINFPSNEKIIHISCGTGFLKFSLLNFHFFF